MTVTNRQSGTNVHEVANGIYRINTPVEIAGAGGFSFNQYLVAGGVLNGVKVRIYSHLPDFFRRRIGIAFLKQVGQGDLSFISLLQ